jgi:hypothetical protein
MREMLANLAAAAQSDERASDSPWLAEARTEARRSDLFLQRYGSGRRVQFESDEGFAALLRRASRREITLTLVGRKGRDFIAGAMREILAEYINILNRPTDLSGRGRNRQSEVIRRYRDGETDAVYVSITISRA